jgi:hypothetical protein
MATPPTWLSHFVNAVTLTLHSHEVLSPLGCHFQQIADVWEITVFASRTEVIGGSRDGQFRPSLFSVDLKSVLALFSSVDEIHWQAQSLGSTDELGSHLSVEGRYGDQEVWLRITAVAPERFDAGRRAMVNQQGFEEVW